MHCALITDTYYNKDVFTYLFIMLLSVHIRLLVYYVVETELSIKREHWSTGGRTEYSSAAKLPSLPSVVLKR